METKEEINKYFSSYQYLAGRENLISKNLFKTLCVETWE